MFAIIEKNTGRILGWSRRLYSAQTRAAEYNLLDVDYQDFTYVWWVEIR